MKIITTEERQAHVSHILNEGFKGLIYGGLISTTLFVLILKRWPQKVGKWNTSIKASFITIPTIGTSAFFADQGSWQFDKEMRNKADIETREEEESILRDIEDRKKGV